MTATNVGDQAQPYVVQAIERAGRILELIQRSPTPLSLSELVLKSDLTKPTVFRMLRSLEHIGLVEQAAEGNLHYHVGLRCVSLGQAYLDQVDFHREAIPFLEQLRDRFNETVHFAVLDEDLRVVYIEKLDGRHAIGIMMSRVGRSAPSYCTGLGKALLASAPGDPVAILAQQGRLKRNTPNTICDPDDLRAELAVIQRRGFSVDLEEHEPGVRCVAATISDSTGSAVAALSIAGPSQRMSEALLFDQLAQAVVQAARDISHRLGGSDRES